MLYRRIHWHVKNVLTTFLWNTSFCFMEQKLPDTSWKLFRHILDQIAFLLKWHQFVLQLVNHVLCRFGILFFFFSVTRKMSNLISWMRISISCHYFLLCSMTYFPLTSERRETKKISPLLSRGLSQHVKVWYQSNYFRNHSPVQNSVSRQSSILWIQYSFVPESYLIPKDKAKENFLLLFYQPVTICYSVRFFDDCRISYGSKLKCHTLKKSRAHLNLISLLKSEN